MTLFNCPCITGIVQCWLKTASVRTSHDNRAKSMVNSVNWVTARQRSGYRSRRTACRHGIYDVLFVSVASVVRTLMSHISDFSTSTSSFITPKAADTYIVHNRLLVNIPTYRRTHTILSTDKIFKHQPLITIDYDLSSIRCLYNKSIS